MSFAPQEEIHGQRSINLAPMIDFLFLMLMFFACLAVTRITTRDTDIDLVEASGDKADASATGDSQFHVIHLSIMADGQYKWITEIRDYAMATPEEIFQELSQQYEKGLLPPDKSKTQVLVKIDKDAHWDPILKAIFAVRQAGFEVHPVYQPD